MKRMILFAFVASICVSINAQNKLNSEMQPVFDACLAMRTAIATGSTVSLKSANEAFRSCKTLYFDLLRPMQSDTVSVNNHFVWDDLFVDSLIAGRNVRPFAQRYSDAVRTRGTNKRTGVYVRTCAVKGKGKAKFSFASAGHKELAVIAEPKGKITLRVFCKKTRKWHNDDEDVNRGREYRIQTFDIPQGVKDTVELEVINCGKEDVSFVIISN